MSERSSRQHCGAECLYLIGSLHCDLQMNLDELEQQLFIGARGIRADELVRVANENGVELRPVSTNWQFLEYFDAPAILVVDGSHYVAFLGKKEGRLLVFDNSYGLMSCTSSWFDKRYQWNGEAFLVNGGPSRWLLWISSPWIAVCSLIGVGILVAVARFQRKPDTTGDPGRSSERLVIAASD